MNIRESFNSFKLKFKEYLQSNKGKKGKVIVIIISILFIITFCGLLKENITMSEEIDELVNKYNTTVDKYNNLVEENKELLAKVDEAKPWFEMKEEEQKAIEEKNAKIKEEEEAKRLAEEEEAERLAEEEAKKGYDTGIGYKDLARNPEDYVGEKIKFQGEVAQVLEGDGEVQIRLAVGGSYNNIIYCIYDSSIVSSRVLEGDYITVMGVSTDLITYTSTIGSEITIPSMLVEKIDM